MISIKLQFNRGFSLIELLVYITILSGILIAASNMFISLSKGQAQSQAKSDVDSSIRFVTELIRQDVKNASSITTPTTGSSGSTLVLIRGGISITYDLSSGSLSRKEGSNSAVNITSNNITVGTPSFTRLENTSVAFGNTNISILVNIPFSYNSTSPDRSYSRTLRTSVNSY